MPKRNTAIEELSHEPILLAAQSATISAKRVTILAYGGGVMRVSGFGKVAIDLRGLELPPKVPLLADHEATLDGTVGYGSPQVQNNQLIIAGEIDPELKASPQLLKLNRAGVGLQASVGVDPRERESIDPGEKITVNGKTLTGPFTLVSTGILREVSILPVGADHTTTVTIAARRATQRKNMAKRNSVIENPITDEDDQDVTATAIAADRERIVDMIRLTAKYPGIAAKDAAELQATAIDENWTSEKFELAMLRTARPSVSRSVEDRGSASIHSKYSPAMLMTAAAMLYAGKPEMAEKNCGAEITQLATDLRCHSMLDLCAASLRIEMVDEPRDRDAMIRAAFSTMSLPIALGNLAEKSSAEAFTETPAVWLNIARRRPVNSFHEQTIARVLLVGNLATLGKTGEIHHATMKETTATVQALTKALMLGVDRQDIINDNLSVFSDTSNALGRAAARTMNDDFAAALLANAGTFFGSGHSNLLTGAGSALSQTSLTSGIANMSAKTDSEGRNVDLRARSLVVSPELENTARALLTSTQMQRYVSSTIDNQPMGNPVQSLALDLYVEPRLSNPIFTGYSTTAWYLFSSLRDGAVNVALLGGRDWPVIEQDQQPFHALGLQFRAYMDYGFALGEYLAALKSNGV